MHGDAVHITYPDMADREVTFERFETVYLKKLPQVGLPLHYNPSSCITWF